MTRNYNLSLPQELDEDLDRVAKKLGIEPAKALARAITLISLAADAEKVELTTRGGVKKEIVIE